MANAWSRSVDGAGSSVTNGTVGAIDVLGRGAFAARSAAARHRPGTRRHLELGADGRQAGDERAAGIGDRLHRLRSAGWPTPGEVGGELLGRGVRIDQRRSSSSATRRPARVVRRLAPGAPVDRARCRVPPVDAHGVAAPTAALPVAAVDQQATRGCRSGPSPPPPPMVARTAAVVVDTSRAHSRLAQLADRGPRVQRRSGTAPRCGRRCRCRWRRADRAGPRRPAPPGSGGAAAGRGTLEVGVGDGDVGGAAAERRMALDVELAERLHVGRGEAHRHPPGHGDRRRSSAPTGAATARRRGTRATRRPSAGGCAGRTRRPTRCRATRRWQSTCSITRPTPGAGPSRFGASNRTIERPTSAVRNADTTWRGPARRVRAPSCTERMVGEPVAPIGDHRARVPVAAHGSSVDRVIDEHDDPADGGGPEDALDADDRRARRPRHGSLDDDVVFEHLPDEEGASDPIATARRRHGTAGAVLAAGLFGIDIALGRKPREDIPVVVASSSEPTDIDTDGIRLDVDEQTTVVAPALPRSEPSPARGRARSAHPASELIVRSPTASRSRPRGRSAWRPASRRRPSAAPRPVPHRRPQVRPRQRQRVTRARG